jgi:hypothetical protein
LLLGISPGWVKISPGWVYFTNETYPVVTESDGQEGTLVIRLSSSGYRCGRVVVAPINVSHNRVDWIIFPWHLMALLRGAYSILNDVAKFAIKL